jgi:pyruvate-formate lyase-activating enzyme
VQGVEILPPEEAVYAFPDAFFLITSAAYKYQIIGGLLSGGKIAPDRILNYEPVEKRKSCVYLESGIVCFDQKLHYCCSDFGKNASPRIAFIGDYDLAVQEFIDYRDKLISDLNRGKPTPCDGCPYIKADYYAKERRIMQFNHSEGGLCNFDCCYCSSPAKTAKSISDDNIDVIRLLDAFQNRNLLSKDLQTNIACGEICVHPRRSEIYERIGGFLNVFCTNASIRDPELIDLLRRGMAGLNVSVDSGTRKTFAAVKGRDLFDKVCENLKLFSSYGMVQLKYIFLPGKNDNIEDIDGFVSLCKAVKTPQAFISYDLHAPPKLPEQTMKMAQYLNGRLLESDIYFSIISDIIREALNVETKQ